MMADLVYFKLLKNLLVTFGSSLGSQVLVSFILLEENSTQFNISETWIISQLFLEVIFIEQIDNRICFWCHNYFDNGEQCHWITTFCDFGNFE